VYTNNTEGGRHTSPGTSWHIQHTVYRFNKTGLLVHTRTQTRMQTRMHTQHNTYVYVCTYTQAQYCTNLLPYTQIHILLTHSEAHGTYSNIYIPPHTYTYVRTPTCTPSVLPEHLAHYTPQALLVTFPVSDISPVMANSCLTGSPWASDSRADTMVQPALGPSLGVAPWSRGGVRVTPAQLHNTG